MVFRSFALKINFKGLTRTFSTTRNYRQADSEPGKRNVRSGQRDPLRRVLSSASSVAAFWRCARMRPLSVSDGRFGGQGTTTAFGQDCPTPVLELTLYTEENLR